MSLLTLVLFLPPPSDEWCESGVTIIDVTRLVPVGVLPRYEGTCTGVYTNDTTGNTANCVAKSFASPKGQDGQL
jgi:hypothetical protein